jgi:MarR family 2-MHQ and catechol resistance regulon transcriptional repressor
MRQDLKTITILFRATNALTEIIKNDVKKHGLNVTEFGTLEVLYHKGTLSVQEIIDKVLIANSSMSYVLTKLIDKGLITKEYNETDRRSFNVSITDKGKAFMDEIYPQHVKTIRSVLNRLNEEEELSLQTLLKKVGKNT